MLNQTPTVEPIVDLRREFRWKDDVIVIEEKAKRLTQLSLLGEKQITVSVNGSEPFGVAFSSFDFACKFLAPLRTFADSLARLSELVNEDQRVEFIRLVENPTAPDVLFLMDWFFPKTKKWELRMIGTISRCQGETALRYVNLGETKVLGIVRGEDVLFVDDKENCVEVFESLRKKCDVFNRQFSV